MENDVEQKQCEVLNAESENDGQRYRCTYNVTILNTPGFEDREVKAYDTIQGNFDKSEQEAMKCPEQFSGDGDRVVTCYVAFDAEPDVALTPFEKSSSDQTIILFVNLGAGAFGLILVAILTILFVEKHFRGRQGAEAQGDEENPRADRIGGDIAGKNGFTKEEVRAIVQKYKIPEGETADDYCCAVCLDDSGGRVCRLPCKHEFHYMCLKLWLRRGGTKCPLCNLALEPETGEDVAVASVASS
eukprot:CAMPEP_0198735396 /NCGR_PEP_ID=MMETSP1475-20131203/59125_1 /TAXON_ID= ORGANISM="Unidentified sp., Strain CCMP1999" /NCGR_SAMPLE_ID=MMETSP1475 /ASSEMBLY_ACC=CAM_ASM_001111 /LENGTH=243 /DNA_ID=CAMNT_0044499053 /DNA_START=275 /DNA_END=1006 /DNA_ORIENTATION=+